MLHFPTPIQEGSMADRIARLDWATTPLGPIESWPPQLQFAVSLALHSDYPTSIYWGEELRLLYNDAWSHIPGERHPDALGRPAVEVWHDIWHLIGPQFEQVARAGKSISLTGQLLPMQRGGVTVETYWDYSFAPLVGDDGKILGVLNHGHEVTRAVLAERRLSFQVALNDRLRGLDDAVEVKLAAAEMLGGQLGAARCGYGQVDEAQETVTVRRDWQRDAGVMSLAGETRILDAFGPRLIDILRRGETLVVEDYRTDPRVSPEHAATWEGIQARSLIVVPLQQGQALTAILYVHDAVPRRWQKWQVELAEDVAERTWASVERAESERLLRESEDHYRHAVELNPQVTWTAVPDGQLNRVAQRWMEWTGTPGTGESWAAGLHPDDRERSFAVWARSVATGEPYDIEHRVKRIDGSYRWARSRAYARRDGRGRILLWYGTTEDVHERKLAEERQRLLINELNHRVKNTLASVQAIAFQTLKRDLSLPEARARFEARLIALSRAHNLLTDQNWTGAALSHVIASAVAHLAPERVEANGPPIWLAPRAALALALALHELGTNAAKYGALSVEEGMVRVTWDCEGDHIHLEWKEQGGPPVEPPARSGFGSRLIERGISADLGGTALLHFEPDGLRCVVEASLAAVQAQEPSLA